MLPLPVFLRFERNLEMASQRSSKAVFQEEWTPAIGPVSGPLMRLGVNRFFEGKGGGYIACNPAQQWRADFDGRGFVTKPERESWNWGLELESYGIGESRIPVSGKAEIEASEACLEYRWDDRLVEWFLNSDRGLEQGWTLNRRSPGNAGKTQARSGRVRQFTSPGDG